MQGLYVMEIGQTKRSKTITAKVSRLTHELLQVEAELIDVTLSKHINNILKKYLEAKN